MELEVSRVFLEYLSLTKESTLFPAKKCIDKATKAQLMTYFKNNPKPNKDEIKEIAKQVKLDQNKVFWFFVNARRKTRENEKKERKSIENTPKQTSGRPSSTCELNELQFVPRQTPLYEEVSPLSSDALALQQSLADSPKANKAAASNDDIFSDSTFSDSWFSDTDYTSSDSFFEESSDCSSESSHKRNRSLFDDEDDDEYPLDRLTLDPL